MSTAKGDTSFQDGLFQSSKINIGDKVFVTQKGEDKGVLSGHYKYLDRLTVETQGESRFRLADSPLSYGITADDGDSWAVIQEDFDEGMLATYAMLSPTDKMELWRREGVEIPFDHTTSPSFLPSDHYSNVEWNSVDDLPQGVSMEIDEECENHIGSWSKAETYKQEVIEEELDKVKCEKKPYNPLDIQHGGGHYKDRAIQPIEYIMSNGLDFCQGNVVKYVSRYKDKNGREDLEKAKHYVEFLIYQWDKENS